MSSSDPMIPETAADGVSTDASLPSANDTSNAPTRSRFTQPIVALPDRKFFIKRMVIAGAMFAIALWFFRDGYVKYPEHNRKVADIERRRAAAEASKDEAGQAMLAKEARETGQPHSPLNMTLQKIGGYPFTLAGIFLLAKFLRERNGELRLENDTLHAPRHPPVPIASITGVENARWDKKGIALFDYRLADGTTGRIRVDDFVFDRPPTDAIHDELIAKMPKAEEI